MRPLEFAKRLGAGVILSVPLAFAALVVCLFTFGLSFPPDAIQLAFLAIGVVSGISIGFAFPKVAGKLFEFLSIFGIDVGAK